MGDRHFDNRRGDFPADIHHHRGNHRDYPHQHDYHHHHQHHHHRNQHNPHDHNYSYHNNFNHSNSSSLAGQPDSGFGGGRFGPNDGSYGHSSFHSGRKRAFHHSGPDCVDGDSYVKLYVASIPRTVTEETIRPLFEEHGNVIEIVLLKDKRTGQQQGACFVKYAKLEEAERAIKVLHNLEAFPGAPDSLTVRYAEREQERLGTTTMAGKLYVTGLNKKSSMNEIEEIFSPYGDVEDIYMVCDEMRRYRGYGFIKYAHRDMASAAINALNGVYTMRGCDRPLAVRFADPKKPKNGDSGVNSAFGGPNFYSGSQERVTRLGSNADDHLGGGPNLPNAISMGNSSTAGVHPEAASRPLQQSPSCQLGAITKLSNFFNVSKCPPNERCPQAVTTISGESTTAILPSSMSTSHAVPESTVTAAPLDCDWSEHTCPDGNKYYFNCITCESRWEKPDEYNWFEQLVMKQLSSLSCQQELKSANRQESTSAVTSCV